MTIFLASLGYHIGKLRQGGWIVTGLRDTAAATVEFLQLQVTFITTLLTENKEQVLYLGFLAVPA